MLIEQYFFVAGFWNPRGDGKIFVRVAWYNHQKTKGIPTGTKKTANQKFAVLCETFKGFDYPPSPDHDRALGGSNSVVPTPYGEGVRSFRSGSFFYGVELGLNKRGEW